MSTLYLIPGSAGPWEADDDNVVADGYMLAGNLAIGPTADGIALGIPVRGIRKTSAFVQTIRKVSQP